MLSRSQLVRDFDLRNVHLCSSRPHGRFFLSAEVRIDSHFSDALHAAGIRQEDHVNVLLTWAHPTVSDPAGDFRLWLSDFTLSSEYREFVPSRELLARVQHAHDNGEHYLYNQPGIGPVAAGSNHVLNDVMNDLISRVITVQQQEIFNVYNIGTTTDPNSANW